MVDPRAAPKPHHLTGRSFGTLVEHPIVDSTKASRELGHDPRALEDTVRDFVRYYEGEAQL